ncbi:hypothetical protein JTB14_031512 [Gonioctena quinquepunctata]|nr:hypothetical protein JTB14_031512 [Gonioctena quinquepunctata]
MDNVIKLDLENPYTKANIFSKICFGWMIELVSKRTKKTLEISDLYKTLGSDKSKTLGDKLEKNWEDEWNRAKLNKTTPSLMRALLKTFSLSYMMWGIPYFSQVVIFRLLQPVILAHFITLFKGTKSFDAAVEMYLTCVYLLGTGAMFMFLNHNGNHGLAVVGMRVRVAVSSLVYRTMLKLDKKSLGETASGQVINLLSNDVNRFDSVAIMLHTLWVLPFQVAVATYFLWQQVQISCLTGVLTMAVVSLPVQSYLGRLCGNLRKTIAAKTDKRVKLMNEVISGIQVIKMYAWEKSFEKIIKTARISELNVITCTSFIRGILASSIIFVHRTSLFLTVICYVFLGNVITSEKVFSMAQFFNLLQLTMAFQFPNAVSLGSETITSIERLQAFLLLKAKETTNLEIWKAKGIQLQDVSARWTPNSYTLKDITLEIAPGSLCVVIGPVGGGKSSLLQILLGELSAKSGKVHFGGEISYSSQEPWLFSSTVRKNILFGQTYIEDWYKKIVKVCCLDKDFEQFPQGDETVVGERGISVSGGQRARINLARAIYRQADIYLMDDPLSAVDPHVGKHLFNECIMDHLRGKTRILVTHQLQFVKEADLIIIINQGIIEARGTFMELSKSDLDFTKLLVEANESNESNTLNTEIPVDKLTLPNEGCIAPVQKIVKKSQQNSSPEKRIGTDSTTSSLAGYFKATKSRSLVITLVILFIISQAVCSGADYWVASWTSHEEIRHQASNNGIEKLPENVVLYIVKNQSMLPLYSTTNDGKSVENTSEGLFDYIEVNDTVHRLLKTDYEMLFYGFFIIGTVSLCVIRAGIFFKICMRASKNLHTGMFHNLLRAPMRFFNENSSGEVLNRFSKDIGAVDELYPSVLLHSIQIILLLTGILVNVVISNPYMIVAMLILSFCIMKLRTWYISTAEDVKRLESATKSPVFSHIDSTLKGVTTIRASKLEKTLIDEFDEHQDVHTAAWFLTISCTFSFGLWFDTVCLLLTACVAFSFIVIHINFTSVSSSMVGLAISQCLMMAGMLQFGMRQIADTIQHLISVERVIDYTKIDTEGPFETPQDVLPTDFWPKRGLIEFKDVSLRYAEGNPPVLKNLNFSVYPGEKVGIVGRTGAGKTSLISALFRLTPTEGSIFIDGLDTNAIGLSDLRKNISIIPQEPVLFSASMRYNLDPFNEFEDDEIWKALKQVELKDVVDSLDFLVTEGGDNFSLGQKQLICLARAILRNNRILVLDEATANVDQRTDSFIQATIREQFKECTVLTIAHRLNTIMDSDKVLVMSFGNVLELGHPFELLQMQDGHFHEMVLETGPMMASQLKNIAFEAHKKKIAAH